MKRGFLSLLSLVMCISLVGCNPTSEGTTKPSETADTTETGTATGSEDTTGAEESTDTCENYQSDLPVIYINTDGSINITSKDKYIGATANITGNSNYADQYSGAIKIRGRGNSSWNEFPKKGYKIKLDTKTDLFGMGENKEWVLLPDYLDECFLRTRFNTGVAKDLGLLTMSGEWVVLILNGEYRGVYELTEQVQIDEESVDIFDWEAEAKSIAKAICKAESDTLTDEDRDYMTDEMIETMSWMTTGQVVYKGITYEISDYYDMNENLKEGYLFELSEEYDETSRFQTTTSHYNIMIKSPEYLAYNEEAMDQVEAIWNTLDEAVNSPDGYASDGTYYADLVDLQSVADYWLLSEFSVNGEAVKKSRFAYMGEDGLITFGPVWDFDYTLDPSKKTLTDWNWQSEVGDFDDATGWKICTSDHDQNILGAFVTHEDFLDLAYSRYNEVMKDSIQSNMDQLEGYYDYLHDEGLKNEAKWKFDRGFEADYETMTSFISARYQWMNETFASKETFLESLQ